MAVRCGETVTGWATSSSSQPSLMLLMLEAAQIDDDHTVLEIGTGTGYNAALLTHRLGSPQVTSIDVDPTVTAAAAARLAVLGYQPTILTGDGLTDIGVGEPVDRIVATVAIPRLPFPWLHRVRHGGRILFPLDTCSGGGIMPLLTVHDGYAQGPFLPTFGGFMPVRRRARQDYALDAFRSVDIDDTPPRETPLPAHVVTDSSDPFEFFVSLATGGLDTMSFTPAAGGPDQYWIADTDRSWCCLTDEDGRTLVREGGPNPLWRRVERIHDYGTALGRPSRERFGLTVRAAAHTVWLDHPDGAYRWPFHNVLTATGVPEPRLGLDTAAGV